MCIDLYSCSGEHEREYKSACSSGLLLDADPYFCPSAVEAERDYFVVNLLVKLSLHGIIDLNWH